MTTLLLAFAAGYLARMLVSRALGAALGHAAELRRLAHGREAQRRIDRLESLLAATRAGLGHEVAECECCGHVAVCHLRAGDRVCARCERELEEQERGDEQWGSRCTPGCGWCGACS